MISYYGKGYLNTDKKSEDYLSVNNFGYTKEIDVDVCIRREYGRLDYQIIYIDRGEGRFLVDGELTDIKSGHVVLICPGEKNHYEFLKGSYTDYYWIHFTGKGVASLLSRLNLSEKIFNVGDFYPFKKTMEDMAKAVASKDFTTEDYLSSSIYMLLSLISKRVHSPENPMDKVILYMQSKNMNEINNSDLAKMCNLSEYHFLRSFKSLKGMTPHRYIAELTKSKSIELLSDTTLSVSEIASSLGFSDSLYFSRFFKKETGASPKNYIKTKK